MDHQAFAQLLGNYGEFVGAIGVVVTLAYLAVQVQLSRQATDANTKVNRAASAALSQDSNAEINKLIATDASLAKIMNTAFGQGSVNGLAPEEVFRLHMIYRADRVLQWIPQVVESCPGNRASMSVVGRACVKTISTFPSFEKMQTSIQ